MVLPFQPAIDRDTQTSVSQILKEITNERNCNDFLASHMPCGL